MQPPVQRSLQTPCPACGGPVSLTSAATVQTVCPWCQATVARDGAFLRRTGQVAEPFEDHSPLQLQATGDWGLLPGAGAPRGRFTLTGRQQFRGAEGAWNEWLARSDDGSEACLSEDNGHYVVSVALDGAAQAELHKAWPAEGLPRPGASIRHAGENFTLTTQLSVQRTGAEGDFPILGAAPAEGTAWEWRSPGGQVLSLLLAPDTTPSEDGALFYLGQEVALSALSLEGLRDAVAEQAVASGTALACPNCGHAVQPLLRTPRSIVCPACHGVITLTSATALEAVAVALQSQPVEPTIAPGSIGTLQGHSWQVVGFMVRRGWLEGQPDETFGWREYLLYNRQTGFQFLVESDEGWSLFRTLTGAPEVRGLQAQWQGRYYSGQPRYRSEVASVAGEFYWPVVVGAQSGHDEFHAKDLRLSRETAQPGSAEATAMAPAGSAPAAGQEVLWSSGALISSDLVAKAFGLPSARSAFTTTDLGPTSGRPSQFLVLIIVLGVLALLIWALSSVNDCDPRIETCGRASGGSYVGGFGGWSGNLGGYSGGGGGSHK